MCGRFTLRTPAKEIAVLFDLNEIPDLTPRYNIAPTQSVAAIRRDTKSQVDNFVLLRWGLIPFWADSPKVGYRMINARAETVSEKPAFRNAFEKRRCVVLADGFFEWKKIGTKKQPFYFYLQDEQPFAFAGLWERWRRVDETIESCTIIVTEANELVEPIHDRMPVILPKASHEMWLDINFQDKAQLESLLTPFPADEMASHPVSTVVNSPRNDESGCVSPLA